MKKRAPVIVLLLVGVLGISACRRQKIPSADTVLIHARIYTMNPKEPWVQAMAVRAGKIIEVGPDKAIAPYQGPSTTVIDARGHMVLPGLVDAHVHFMAGSAVLDAELADKGVLKQRVRGCILWSPADSSANQSSSNSAIDLRNLYERSICSR